MNEFFDNYKCTNYCIAVCSLLEILIKLDGDLLKTVTIYKYNVGQSNPQDQK